MGPGKRLGILILFTAAAALARAGAAPADPVQFQETPGQLRITVGGRPFATYVYEDPKVLRPYFAHVREPGGLQVTRNYPPVAGQDAVDHDTMHPGIWLAFGDLGRADFWRNKGRVEQVRFVEPPRGGAGSGRFAVERRYVAADGRMVARETCRYAVLVRPAGTLLIQDSTFKPEAGTAAFGDQEEMGFGVRVATPLAVKAGGQITNSDGLVNEKAVWGKPADWADYSGTLEGRRVGLCVMAAPGNFRRPWFHARDYGLLVANPFGRKAFTGGEPSSVPLPAGEPFRLRFGVLVHGGSAGQTPGLATAYKDFVQILDGSRAGK